MADTKTKPDPIDKNKCGVCGQEKPVNEYCTNDCRYLLKGKPEDVIPAIFGAYRGGRYLPACVRQIEYLLQSATEKAEVEGRISEMEQAWDWAVMNNRNYIKGDFVLKRVRKLKALLKSLKSKKGGKE